MGLDSVELLIRIEREFGLEITDREAERMATPCDAANLVCSRISLAPSHFCLTRQAFLRLRKAMCMQGLLRRAVAPRVRFADVYDSASRRREWHALGDLVGRDRWPGLTRPWRRPLELEYPRGCETVWGLARHLATWDARVPVGVNARWWREAVLLRIRQITTEELGVTTFNDDDHYVRDLGVD